MKTENNWRFKIHCCHWLTAVNADGSGWIHNISTNSNVCCDTILFLKCTAALDVSETRLHNHSAVHCKCTFNSAIIIRLQFSSIFSIAFAQIYGDRLCACHFNIYLKGKVAASKMKSNILWVSIILPLPPHNWST